MSNRVNIDGVEIVLAQVDDHQSEWLDFDFCVQRLQVAWLRLSPKEPPLNPRIVGEPLASLEARPVIRRDTQPAP